MFSSEVKWFIAMFIPVVLGWVLILVDLPGIAIGVFIIGIFIQVEYLVRRGNGRSNL